NHLPREEAARSAKKLSREKNALAAAWALVIEAGDVAEAEPVRASLLYQRAVEAADRAGMRATAAAAQWRVAMLRENAEMQSGAEAALAALGVRNAARTCALLAPMRGQP